MSPRRWWAIARKETLHILRDPRSLGLAILLPMGMLLLFVYALDLDVDDVGLVVWDQSATPESRELISRFDASTYFRLRGMVTSDAEIAVALDRGEARAGLVIPPEFARDLPAGRDVTLQVVVDGSDPLASQLALGYAASIAQAHSIALAIKQVEATGLEYSGAPIDLRSRAWFNEDLRSRNYIVPGLIAVVMMVIAGLLTSLTIAREWETGPMEQLITTPVRPTELILGKLAPYFALGVIDVVLAILLSYFVFDVPLRGSLVLVGVVTAIFLVGAFSLGIVISVVTKSQLLASQLAMIATFLPSFLMSGFVFAIPNMPGWLQAVSYAISARYFITIQRAIWIKGAGVDVIAPELAALVVFSGLFVLLAIKRFHKRLD